jgi:Ca2+-binding RTX toxin-like protein
MPTNNAFLTEVLNLTNQFRAKNNLPGLKLNTELQASAQSHSKNMAQQDFFSHTGKDGSQAWDRAKRVGYEANAMGENIAAGQTTPKTVVDGWINSPGHRANLLNASYTELGVGYFLLKNDTGKINYKHYWTQVFGSGDTNPASNLPRSRATASNPSARAATTGSSRTLGVMQVRSPEGDLFLTGSAEDETLVGGDRNDRLKGGGGADTLTGGTGADQFQFSRRSSDKASNQVDDITDFEVGVDQVVLDRNSFKLKKLDQIGIVQTDGQVGRSRQKIVYSQETGSLFFNENGRRSGLGVGERIVRIDSDNNPLTTAPILTISDFQLG